MKIPIFGGAYEGRSTDVAPQTCINLFYEKTIDGDSLVGTPGSTVFATPKIAPVRGAIEFGGLAYFVVGDSFFEVNALGVASKKGTVSNRTTPVSMAHNGVRSGSTKQIFIADGERRHIYDKDTDTLTTYTDYAAQSVAYIDSYFIFSVPDSDQFYLTSLSDGTTVDASDLFTAEGDPDEIQALVADRRELFIFGKKTLEVWYNSGDSDNTFQRFQGGFTQTGCAAQFSVARTDNNLYWLTENERGYGQVAMLGQGYQPMIISTPEVSYQMSQYSTLEDAVAYSYQYEGHEFYVLTFPTAKATWVYDASTKVWHQRAHVIDDAFPNRERYNCHVFAYGKHLFGDFANGKIYELDASVGTIDGTRIPRERTTAGVGDEERRIRINEIQLDMEEGIGDPNTANDADVWLSYSKDGGHTFSHERKADAGDTGSYSARVLWRRLGLARNWIFRWRTWSPKRIILKGAYARIHGNRRA